MSHGVISKVLDSLEVRLSHDSFSSALELLKSTAELEEAMTLNRVQVTGQKQATFLQTTTIAVAQLLVVSYVGGVNVGC